MRMNIGTLQRRQRHQERLSDLKIWLLCTSSVFLVAFAATWRLVEPPLKRRLFDELANKIDRYAFILSHGGVVALRRLEPGTPVSVGGPVVKVQAKAELLSQSVVQEFSRQAVVVRLLRTKPISAIQPVDGIFQALPSGYWIHFKLRDQPSGSIWIYHDQGLLQLELWRIWLICVVAFSLLLGTLVYLRFHLVEPLSEALDSLPGISTRNMALLPEVGGMLARRVCAQINCYLSDINENSSSQRTLLRGLTHDLRGPLGRIKLRSEQLISGLVPEDEIAQDVSDMQYDVDQLCAITDRLYAYSDDLMDHHCRLCEVQLSDILSQIVASYADSSILVDAERLVVRLDPVALKRSLNNLIDNALEYGVPPVVVSSMLLDGMVVIRVEDHGKGFIGGRQLLMPRIPASSDRHESTHRGLGLGIVEQFCQSHGGTLHLGRSAFGGLLAEMRLSTAC